MKVSIVFLVTWAILGTLTVVGALALGGVVSSSWAWLLLPLALISAVVPAVRDISAGRGPH